MALMKKNITDKAIRDDRLHCHSRNFACGIWQKIAYYLMMSLSSSLQILFCEPIELLNEYL